MGNEAVEVLSLIRGEGIFSALAILLLTWALARVLRATTARLAHRLSAQRLLVEQVSAFLRFALYVAGTLAAVRAMFDLSKEVLTVVGGTVVVTVGLVLKDQASSVLAGIMILIEKPFQVGDRIHFGGYYGEVRSIGLRSVRIVTLDDNEVTIPSSRFLTDPVASSNSGELTMMVEQDFFIGADQDFQAAKKIVADAVTNSRFFLPDKPWTVLVHQVQRDMITAIRLRAKAYVLELHFEKSFESDVHERVLEGFRSAGIEPPRVLVGTPKS